MWSRCRWIASTGRRPAVGFDHRQRQRFEGVGRRHRCPWSTCRGSGGDVVGLSLDRITWATSARRDRHRGRSIEAGAVVNVSRALGSIARGCGFVIGTDGDVVAVSLDRFTWAALGRRFRSSPAGTARGRGALGIASQLGPLRFDHRGGRQRVEGVGLDHPGRSSSSAPMAMWWRRDPVHRSGIVSRRCGRLASFPVRMAIGSRGGSIASPGRRPAVGSDRRQRQRVEGVGLDRLALGRRVAAPEVTCSRCHWIASPGRRWAVASDHHQRERLEGVGRWSSRRSSGASRFDHRGGRQRVEGVGLDRLAPWRCDRFAWCSGSRCHWIASLGDVKRRVRGQRVGALGSIIPAGRHHPHRWRCGRVGIRFTEAAMCRGRSVRGGLPGWFARAWLDRLPAWRFHRHPWRSGRGVARSHHLGNRRPLVSIIASGNGSRALGVVIVARRHRVAVPAAMWSRWLAPFDGSGLARSFGGVAFRSAPVAIRSRCRWIASPGRCWAACPADPIHHQRKGFEGVGFDHSAR